jgi:small-conductance mechanosensitive channel
MLGQRNFAPGAEVRIIDGANHIEGKVVEINLFSTVLLTKNNDQVVYPNNLIVSRPVIVQHHLTTSKGKTEHRWRRRHPDHR